MEYHHCHCIRETLWFMTQINQSLLLLSNLQYWGNYISHGAFVVILLLLPLQKEPKFTFYQQLRRYFENVPRRQQQQLPSKLSTRVHKWLSIWHERRNPAVLSLGTKKVVKDRRTRKKSYNTKCRYPESQGSENPIFNSKNCIGSESDSFLYRDLKMYFLSKLRLISSHSYLVLNMH